MSDMITSMGALERIVGKVPSAMTLKVIDHIDQHAKTWIQASRLVFVCIGKKDEVMITLGGGAEGFVLSSSDTLSLPLQSLDHSELLAVGDPCATLFVVPGKEEMVRANGRIVAIENGVAKVQVEECFGHCAKAFKRSSFWRAKPREDRFASETEFANMSPFLALATVNNHGGADLSPKGDPTGKLAFVEGSSLWFADRPGNRRMDSYRNIVSNPNMAAAFLIPGSSQVLIARGKATPSTDEKVRQQFTVNDKTPALSMKLEYPGLELIDSPALQAAQLWSGPRNFANLDAAKMFSEHVKLNKNKGITAKFARAMVSIPGVMKAGLEKDYKDNLY